MARKYKIRKTRKKLPRRKSLDYYPIAVDMLANGASMIDVCNYLKDNTWMNYNQAREQVIQRIREVEAERANPKPEEPKKKKDDREVLKILRKKVQI